MTKNVKYFVKYKKEEEQNRHAGPLLLPSHQIPLKLRLSPHQHRHKSQRTICLSSSSTLRLMLRPVETNLPKANISSSETWRGGSESLQHTPKSPVPLSLIRQSVWSMGTEESAGSFLVIWGHQLKTEAVWEPSAMSLCDWVRKELKQNNSQSISPLISIFSRSPWAVFAESDTKIRLADRGQDWEDVSSLNISM